MGWQGEVAAQIRALVGTTPLIAVEIDGGAPVWGPLDAADLVAGRLRPARPTPLAAVADASQQAVLVSFVGSASPGDARWRLLAEVRRVLAPGGRLLLLDHNRPRRRLVALCALLAAPVPPGGSPGERWRRLAYTTAREAQAAGFAVDALRFAGGERVQLVVACTGDAAAAPSEAGA